MFKGQKNQPFEQILLPFEQIMSSFEQALSLQDLIVILQLVKFLSDSMEVT